MESKNDEATLEAYSTDASIFKVHPKEVYFPTTIEDISQLIESGRKITARGAGTDMSGGPLTEFTVIDMTHGFNEIKEIDKITNEVWVGAGAYYRDLEAITTQHGSLKRSVRKFCRLLDWG